MSLAHALLTSLQEKSSSGYDLARRFDKSIGFFWRATHQQIYRELARMEAAGWITSEAAPDGGRTRKKLYKFTDTLSATAQVMTKYRATGEYKPDFDWAFAKWQAAPAVAVRVGRIGAPFFMISDFRDVGYANTTVRPPLDVYGQVPVSSVDGGDISYQTNIQSATVTATLWGGQTKAKYASALRSNGTDVDPTLIKLRNQIGLNLQAEFDGGYTLRLGHMQGKLSLESSAIGALTTGLSGVLAGGAGATAQALAAQMLGALDTTGQKATFTGLGASMDRDNIVLATEYTWRRVDKGIVPDTTGWYLLGGYRFGTVLPYVVVSRLTIDEANTALNPQAAALGTAYAGAQSLVKAAGKIAQNTLSVGARWDFHRGMALKAQFDRVNKPSSSNGLFLNPDAFTANGQDFYNNHKKVNVLSLAVDFVF